MKAPNAIIKTKVASEAAAPRIRYNPAHRRKPFPLPLRPLVADRFKPPKGQKKIFLYESFPPPTSLNEHTLPYTNLSPQQTN